MGLSMITGNALTAIDNSGVFSSSSLSLAGTFILARNYTATPLTSGIIHTRSIGDLYADITISEKHQDTYTVTEHPLQDGTVVSDHVIRNQPTITLEVGVTDATTDQPGNYPSITFYEKLLALAEAKEPITVDTGKRTYENMVITEIVETTTQQTENCGIFIVSCKQVQITNTKKVKIPAERMKGAATTQSVTNGGTKTVQEDKSVISALTGYGDYYNR